MTEHTSTEILRGMRVFSLPSSARWMLLSLLVALGAINAALFAIGISQHERQEWVKASLELMSVILPFLLLAVIVFFSSSIATQTRKRTLEFLLLEAPSMFSAIREPEETFQPRLRRLTRQQFKPKSTTLVEVKHAPGSCCAEYRLSLPPSPARNAIAPQQLILRLELNVHRLTFCLAIDSNRISPSDKADVAAPLNWFSSTFSSTLSGARHAFLEASHAHMDTHAGYHFNRCGTGLVAGVACHWFVASRDLKSDFLWDASERIFILQDILFMLRAFMAECPQLFASEN